VAASHDQHSGSDQLMTDMGGRPRVPGTGGDACGLSEHMVAAIGDLTQLGDGLVKVAASAVYRIAVP
jgi:hypothetical protein